MTASCIRVVGEYELRSAQTNVDNLTVSQSEPAGALFKDIESLLDSRDQGAPQDWLTDMKNEVDIYSARMKEFRHMPADEAMGDISSMSARVHEMILQTVKVDSRQATNWRVNGLLPTRDELRFQFEVMSRLVTIMKIETDQLRGNPF